MLHSDAQQSKVSTIIQFLGFSTVLFIVDYQHILCIIHIFEVCQTDWCKFMFCQMVFCGLILKYSSPDS